MYGYLGDLGIQYFQLAMKQVLLHYCKNTNNLYNRYACIFYQNFCLAMFKKTSKTNAHFRIPTVFFKEKKTHTYEAHWILVLHLIVKNIVQYLHT